MHSIEEDFDLSLYKEEFVHKKTIDGKVAEKENFLNSTTGFFRDLDVFEELKEVLSKENKEKLRILNIGCSTGEETYSLGIILHELGLEYEIFATDINENSLACASRGVYEEDDVEPLTLQQKEEFFTIESDSYFISKEIKKNIMFFKESISTLGKYNEIDIVVCRNLLIYLKKDVQKKFSLDIHRILNDDGIVVLGKSEYPEEFDKLFNSIDFSKKIFRKRNL